MSDGASWDAVYLSPHLDDVALSCGGQIARRSAAGERLLVVTVFAGDEPPPPVSRLAASLHRAWRLDRGVVAARRREDAAACAALGAEPHHLPFREAIYRRDRAGGPRYRRLGSLFGRLHPGDRPLVAELAAALAALPPHRRLVAPLGAGGHVDHRLARCAAEAVAGGRLDYYEEYPYGERFARLAPLLRRARGWRDEVVPVPDQALDRKCAAVAAYRSQVAPLFGGPAAVRPRLERARRRVGGERLWRR